MREFKFRFYDKELEKFVDIEEIGVEMNGSWWYLKCTDDEQPPYNLNELEVMQFTGLRDKNGFEIYEGDVVTDDHNYYLVEFKHGMFKPICYAMLDEKGLATGYEIIGNIHENPELLGDDK